MNFLSKNIRFLRKKEGLSQQQFADALGVKRSNIAAYETKNVEPRLELISKMATFFSVSLADLVTRDFGQLGEKKSDSATRAGVSVNNRDQLISETKRVRKMLDGFKVFYEYKSSSLSEAGDANSVNMGDIDNFLVFIDHMLNYTDLIKGAVGGEDQADASDPSFQENGTERSTNATSAYLTQFAAKARTGSN